MKTSQNNMCLISHGNLWKYLQIDFVFVETNVVVLTICKRFNVTNTMQVI
jgi:hypothetical protein